MPEICPICCSAHIEHHNDGVKRCATCGTSQKPPRGKWLVPEELTHEELQRIRTKVQAERAAQLLRLDL